MASETINQLPAANTIDGTNDLLALYQNSSVSTLSISRSTFLGVSGQPADISSVQTLTNKTLTSPTISGPTLSGTITGTYIIGGSPTFPASVVTLTGSQTLTNKTLTSPTINSPTITNATISADALTAFTTLNTGTLYGISITSAVITTAGSVGSGANVTNGVQAAALATNAITLGYVQITADVNTTSTSYSQVAGLTLTVTIPAGGRRIRVTAHCGSVYNSTSGDGVGLSLWDGVVASGTQLDAAEGISATGNYTFSSTAMAVLTPAAGSKTYNVGIKAITGGTAHTNSQTIVPSFLLVEAI